MDSELEKYISDKSFPDKIQFLIKAWKSNKLTAGKFSLITKCFIANFELQPHSEISESDWESIKEFVSLKYPNNLVSVETKKSLVEVWIAKLKKLKNDPKEKILESVFLLICHDNLKDLYKSSLSTFTKLVSCTIKCIESLISSNSWQNQDNLEVIIKELTFYSKLKSFKELFLSEILENLFKLTKKSNSKHQEDLLDLVNATYFSQLGLTVDDVQSSEIFNIFKEDLSDSQVFCLYESFVSANRSKAADIVKVVGQIFHGKIATKEGIQFLSDIEAILTVLKKYEVDISSIKRLDEKLFEEIETKVQEFAENLDEMKDLEKFFEIMTSLVNLDPFLFQNDIYEILVNSMFREKTSLAGDFYENFLKISMKFFGKDIVYFAENLIENIEEKLENYEIPKRRKRKLSVNLLDSKKKKKRLSKKVDDGEVAEESIEFSVEEPAVCSPIWPESLNSQFSDAVVSLNVKQSLKLWNLLNNFLKKYLVELQESSSGLSENQMFKLEFVIKFINNFLLSSRLHEHLSYKFEEILSEIENFNKIQDFFHSLIINIEYNSRLMNCFLTLSQNYENFLLVYFYHFNPDVQTKLNAIFIHNKFGKSSEWSIIKQRIKNFGKYQEKNISNQLGLQQQLKIMIFNKAEIGGCFEDVETVLADPTQIEYILMKSELSVLFLQLLKPAEFKKFCEFLVTSENLELKQKSLQLIRNHPERLESLVETLLSADIKSFQKTEILKILPLNFLSLEKKKRTFECLLNADESNPEDLTPIVSELFNQDGYKSFFKDFKLFDLMKTFKDTQKYAGLYKIVLQSTIRRLSQDTLTNLKELAESSGDLEKNVVKLIEIVLQIFHECVLTPIGVSDKEIKELKVCLVSLLLQHINKSSTVKKKVENLTKFEFLLKVGASSFSDLNDSMKKEFQEKLEKLIKFGIKSSDNPESIQFLLTTLQSSKTLNLNDEMKISIVTELLSSLKKSIKNRLESETFDFSKSCIEISLVDILKSYKTNCGNEVIETIQENFENPKVELTADKLEFAFKLIQVVFNGVKNGPVGKYTEFCGSVLPKLTRLEEDENKSAVLCQILETHLKVLRISQVQHDFQLLDELLYFMTDIKTLNQSFQSIEDFHKFYSLFGEFLYTVSNFKQQYFVARIPQFFGLYKNFLEAIYYYKTDSTDDFTAKEIDLLLKLSQQLENVMKNIVSNQLNHIKIILPYIVTSILSVFVKNPKTLTCGDKFKINIKNVCKLLISNIDEKNTRFIFGASDETAREVFETFVGELRRKF